MEHLLAVQNLRVSFHTYAGEVQAVRGVDFSLKKGSTMAIVGESGCGKTVTSKAIMGLIATPPGEIKADSSILFEGRNILQFGKKDWHAYRGADAGMIFQDPMTSLNPTMKVGKQIMESLMLHKGMNRAEAKAEAIRMLDLVKIPNAADRIQDYPHQFSGGMRQRVMIAIALACNPKLIIADEPTTALDVTVQAQILDLLSDLQKQFGTSIILITHDLGVVAGMAESIVVMYAGQIIERGMVEEIFANPLHCYTKALLRAVPVLSSQNKEELSSIPGTPPDLIAPPQGCAFASRCVNCMKICRQIPPPLTVRSNTHSASCWLMHPQAPQTEVK